MVDEKLIALLVPYVQIALNLSTDLAYTELTEYQKIFKLEGLKAMVGFIQWRENNIDDESNDNVLYGAIAHDIQDRNELCFLPRTSDYLKYYNDERGISIGSIK